MIQGRLRTKFLLSLLLITAGLTSATLLIVRHRVRLWVRDEMTEALVNSVVTFQNFQRQREATLARSAVLLANWPSVKSLMTTQHEQTIQDASTEYWRQIGSDLFVLADRTGKVVALHTASVGLSSAEAQQFFQRWLQNGAPSDWWFGSGHLYEVFLQPIYFGSPSDNTMLGVLAVGYEVDGRLAQQVSQIASSQVAFRYGNDIVASTLPAEMRAELQQQGKLEPGRATRGPADLDLANEHFLFTSLDLAPGTVPAVRLDVLKSYAQATQFLDSINQLLLAVGLAAVIAGGLLVYFISDTFTRPLASLVDGFRALERGDFAYPLAARGNDEVSELTRAFDRMRQNLEKTQHELLHAERLATTGRMASTISHDLRHPLTAILAYAEFLSEGNLGEQQRKDLYQEIRQGISRMTDLISSLLEFSKTPEALRPAYVSVEEIVRQAVHTIQVRPEFRRIHITVSDGVTEGWFDPGKLDRVFHNLLLNACEAVSPESGSVRVTIRKFPEAVEVRVADNGQGIFEPVRANVFQPFVSYGKENGTGLGLAVVHKIVQDHGGHVDVETTGAQGTVFVVVLPLTLPEKIPA
jgi:signal transduction histidine kinase